LSFDSLHSLARLGWNDRWAALFAPHSDAGLVAGRVLRGDRDRVTVGTAAGAVVALARDLPATGDWVGLDLGPELARVAAVLPRASAQIGRAHV